MFLPQLKKKKRRRRRKDKKVGSLHHPLKCMRTNDIEDTQPAPQSYCQAISRFQGLDL